MVLFRLFTVLASTSLPASAFARPLLRASSKWANLHMGIATPNLTEKQQTHKLFMENKPSFCRRQR
jgi:hypothetical protein